MYDMYLAHHGILGQKWGVRRFQNPDGSLTSAGKLRYAPDGNGGYRKLTSLERRAAEKAAKKRTAALDKARKARVEKAEYDKEKKEAIKSGDASKVDKYFKDMSQVERNEAIANINTKQNFQRLLNQEAQLVSQGKSKTDVMMDKMAKTTQFAEKGIAMYNVIAKINNAFNSDSFMPTIGGEWAGDRKKKLLKEAKEEEEKAKEKKEQEKIEKLIRTADEDTLLKNESLLSAKDWSNALVIQNAKNKLRDQKEEAAKKQERDEVEKMIRTADDYTLLQNSSKLGSKDWAAAIAIQNAKKAAMTSMAEVKKARLTSEKEMHEQLAAEYEKKSKDIMAEAKRREEKFDKLADAIMEADNNSRLASEYSRKANDIKVTTERRGTLLGRIEDSINQASQNSREAERYKQASDLYRREAVSRWMHSGSEEAFNKIRDQFSYEEQAAIRKARGW